MTTHGRSLRVLAIACAAIALGGKTQAAVSSPKLVFPPANSTYLQTPSSSVSYPTLNYSISGLTFKPTANGVQLSTTGDTVDDTWPSSGSLQGTSGGATSTSQIACTSNITLGADQQGSSFRFKLVAVKTISWSYADDPQKRVRVSPTNPSTGEFDYTTQSDGTYQIASFLNLNTQASFDGGTTWTDGATPLHLDLVAVPEPATALLLAGAVPFARRRRLAGRTS